MKKMLNGFLVLSIFSLLAGCNAGKDKDKTETMPATTDSTVATTAADNTMTNSNPTTADSVAVTTVTPNPDKKGKKGKVIIAASDNKTAGEMDVMDKEGYYTNVYPSYPGGDNALANFFEKNIQYPSNASENGVEGTVRISFMVDENGKISAPKTTTPTIGYGLEDEALRVFKKMPNWKPGSLKGKNVKTRYTLPVRFQLEG